MQYKHAKEQANYSDFSSGRVFYSVPGHPAFPVRLASEIFQRCLAQRQANYGINTPCTLYDPCCGAAYHLSVVAYLHGEHLREVIGSDIDEKAVGLAKRNLGLLSTAGLEQRIHEISEMLERYGKESHLDALTSAMSLKKRLLALRENQDLDARVFQANATDREQISSKIEPNSVDIVFTDVPYGRHSQWSDSDSGESPAPLDAMLEALPGSLSHESIVAIVSDKQQKVHHEVYQRLEQFQVGKRRIVIMKPV